MKNSCNARDQGYGNNSSQRQNLVGVGSKKDVKVEAKQGKGNFVLTGTTGAVSHPNAKLVYLRKKDGRLALTWGVETDVPDNWLLSYVDAYHSDMIHNVADYVSDLATYQVYLWTVNDPTEGARTSLNDPWKYGRFAIHMDNPTGGDDNESNYRPDSPSDTFVYPYDPSQSDPTSYVGASITQLFFTANKYHDLLYVLGFDEKGGNVQGNNNGKGEKGNDAVVLFSQDGFGTNNVNVVVHENTHGRKQTIPITVFTLNLYT
ncbi:extracellular elastinolytic metalloproteinase precursor [Metarhizium robertsii ARSEF 23]|uniref:Extracellular metalloproteinase n=1 Tax=Metarhizium robertsii (strain ARSEF 23 / ATCC MYA-3075) TaxID=655844 RepID=E9ETK0_METRA|nr:extracellular elastinolytic metalloproteinase precursor [Metarhizium robertsii ARSEF 23]EFZ00753.2 extracellular elastinolytic metalloproteinase precursor [Metarhizium robertsii ARSEF 23]